MVGMMVFVSNPRIQLAVAGGLKNLCYIASTRPVRTTQQDPTEREKTGAGSRYVLQKNSKDQLKIFSLLILFTQVQSTAYLTHKSCLV